MLRISAMCSCVLVLLSATLLAAPGSITGTLEDLSGQRNSVENVVVFVADAKTGWPLLHDLPETFSPSGSQGLQNGLAGFRHTMTDGDGRFELKDIPAGEWRLVAQQWVGVTGIPEREASVPVLMLHGVVNHVVVQEGQVTDVVIRQLGDKSVILENNPNEGNAFVFLSTEAPFGEPILGPFGWGDGFRSRMIAVTHQNHPPLTVLGLPDAKVFVSLLNYDNNPGFGGLSFVPGKTLKQTILIYALWSNGYHTPPDRLLPLVDYFDQSPRGFMMLVKSNGDVFPADTLRPDGRLVFASGFEAMKDTFIDVPGAGRHTVPDIFAAQSYSELRKWHLARKREQNAR